MAFTDRGSLTSAQTRDALNRLIDGFQTLVREHLALAKVELKEDLNRMGRSLLLSAAGIPALVAGYLLFNAALALLLATVMESWIAFGIVAVANLAAGSALTVVFGKKAKETRISLSETESEMRRDREMLSALKSRGAETRGSSEPGLARLPGDGSGPVADGHGRRETRAPWHDGHGSNANATSAPSGMSPARPQGKAGSTAGLERRSQDPTPGQPVAGATSTPDGEPMMATRDHH